MGKIKKCAACNRYTLHETCPSCGAESVDPEPPTFSQPDRHGEYRREAKRKQRGNDDG